MINAVEMDQIQCEKFQEIKFVLTCKSRTWALRKAEHDLLNERDENGWWE